jgi:Mannitol repressor
VSKALRTASKRRPSDSELDAIFTEIRLGGERGSVLLAASMIENVLEGAIAFRFGHLSKSDLDDLFTGTAPLATFSAKIKIAYAMGVIGKNTRHDLDSFREMRNAFAHSIVLLTLTQPEVANLLNGMNAYKDLPFGYTIDHKLKLVGLARLLMLHLTAKMRDRPLKVQGIEHLD